MNLQLLKTFNNSMDMHLMRVQLESDGILCYIFDENIVSVNPLYNLTVGGIKLKVKEVDYERALELLTEIENRHYTDEENKEILCPSCGSNDIFIDFNTVKDKKSVFALILSFLLFIYPFYMAKTKRCKKCDHEFS